MLGKPRNSARAAAGRDGTSAKRSSPAKRGGAVDSKIKPPDHRSMLARHASTDTKIKPPD
jgi:hypothetical protein